MKLFTKLCVALTLFAAAVLPTSAEAKAKSNYKNFKVAIYTRAYEVEKMTDPEWLKSTWDVISNQVKVDKIYLETHRDLLIIKDGSISGYNDVETYRHRYPMWLISRDFEHAHLDRSKYAWVHTEGQADFNTKTLFDPCPPGYKLPTTREWDNFKNNEFEYTNPAAFSSGPFGYCISTEAEASIKATSMTNGVYDYPETHDAWATLATRREAGDYYEVDEYNGRRYHTRAMSAHGDEIITCFPASGAIQDGGAFYSIGANFALWASGRVESIDGNDYTHTRYDAHWFGIKDNWSSDWKESYDWTDTGSWRVYCPYLRDDENWTGRKNLANNPIGAVVLGIGTPAMEVDGTGHHSGLGTASNYAVPVRCIRQYDSTAGRTTMSEK